MKTRSKSKAQNFKLAVIIPAYNEARGIAVCVNQVLRVVKSRHLLAKLLVIDDGSTDQTGAILKQLQQKYPGELIVKRHQQNQGYGAALKSGIKTAIRQGFEFGLFMDSDLTNSPADIERFYKLISHQVDCVKASRYVSGGKVKGVPFPRRIFSVVGNIVASALFRINVKDCTNGFRMVRLKLVRDIPYREKGFAIILEEFYYLNQERAKFRELPITLTARKGTKSSFRYTPGQLWRYLKYPLQSWLNSATISL